MDILSYVLGLQAGKASGGGGGSSERKTIYSETEHHFSYNSGFGTFSFSDMSLLFNLEKDKEYIVVWDGTEYPRTAFEFTAADGANCVAVGNPIAAGQADNGDSFAIVTDKTNSVTHFISTETISEHTVAIYQEESGEAGGNVTYKKGVFTATESQMDIEHGGNEVPDFLMVYIMSQPGNNNTFVSYGFSEAMLAKMGGGYHNVSLILNNASAMELTSNLGIETAGSGFWSSYGGLRNVTDTTFRVGCNGAMGGLKTGETSYYNYVAVFGLA